MKYPESLFDAFMYPLEAMSLAARRRALVPRATGDVLELGAGTGVNLEHYRADRVGSLTVTDLAVSALLQRRVDDTRTRLGGAPVAVRDADASLLPFPDASFDTVVFTLLFCSVPDQANALAEVHRVLRPGGRVIFIEHVRPHGVLGRLADRLNPLWRAATGECNINRDTARAIGAAGFSVEQLDETAASVVISGVACRSAPAL